jgi:hypothetical protein
MIRKKNKTMAIKTLFISFILLAFTSDLLYSQTEETLCLKEFNSLVYNSLRSNSGNDSIDLSSNNIRIVFELYVSECGKIDSANILKSNLHKIGISHSVITSSIVGNVFPCLRDYYIPKDGLLPERINIKYNTIILEEK